MYRLNRISHSPPLNKIFSYFWLKCLRPIITYNEFINVSIVQSPKHIWTCEISILGQETKTTLFSKSLSWLEIIGWSSRFLICCYWSYLASTDVFRFFITVFLRVVNFGCFGYVHMMFTEHSQGNYAQKRDFCDIFGL